MGQILNELSDTITRHGVSLMMASSFTSVVLYLTLYSTNPQIQAYRPVKSNFIDRRIYYGLTDTHSIHFDKGYAIMDNKRIIPNGDQDINQSLPFDFDEKHSIGYNDSEKSDGMTLLSDVSKQYFAPRVSGKYLNCPTYKYLQKYLPEVVLQRSVYLSDCTTIRIKGKSLSITTKVHVYNEIIDLQTKFALLREAPRKYPTNVTLLKYFGDNTNQRGGLLSKSSVFKMVESNRFITTIYIEPNIGEEKDDLITDYFRCTASGPVLKWTQPMNGAPPICLADLHTLSKPHRSMDTRSYNYHGWSHEYRRRQSGHGVNSSFTMDWNINCEFCRDKPSVVTYAHIIRKAVMVDPAVAYQVDNKSRIVPLQCGKIGKGFPIFKTFSALLSSEAECSLQQTRDVVFSIANHFQGTDTRFNFYHTFGESTVKLALYMDFLRANPQIPIHVRGQKASKWVQEYIKRYLELSNEVISGTVYAKVLIIPEGNPCFRTGYLYLQSTRNLLIENMKLEFLNTHPGSILYIQRTKTRVLKDESRIAEHLSSLAKQHNLNFNVFTDAREISMFVAANLFYNSLLTVGAHGAGLTNIIFAQPKTAVFEIVCDVSPVTFMLMSHKLGLRHHAFYGHRVSNNRCDDGIRFTNELEDFQSKTSEILQIVMEDFNML